MPAIVNKPYNQMYDVKHQPYLSKVQNRNEHKLKTAIIVFGTRPEAIKMAPVVLEMKRRATFKTLVCVSGQHRQMLDSVLATFALKADADLSVMKPNQGLPALAASITSELGALFQSIPPDLVLVQGDTTTAMCAALAGFYSNAVVGHVEAGLRTWDLRSPWPEEGNRRIISAIADLHFAPTNSAANNLLRENIPKNNIVVSGNTVIDAISYIDRKLSNSRQLRERMRFLVPVVESGQRIILVTGHRRENIGTGLEGICEAIRRLAVKYTNVVIVFPVHPNPNVQKIVLKKLRDITNIRLCEPLEYTAFVYLMRISYLILTDSGGIQEEAPFLGKPVLVLRDDTERPEAVAAGTVKLVGTDPENIVKEASLLLDDRHVYERMSQATNPYGDGRASYRIVDRLESLLSSKKAPKAKSVK